MLCLPSLGPPAAAAAGEKAWVDPWKVEEGCWRWDTSRKTGPAPWMRTVQQAEWSSFLLRSQEAESTRCEAGAQREVVQGFAAAKLCDAAVSNVEVRSFG